MIGGSIWLVSSRAESLRSEHRLDSLFSREAVFLLNNLVLVALCFVVFWGTFFPLIAEAFTGRQRNIGPPVYEQFVVPLALILVLLSGIGPVIAWRRANAANLRRNLLRPALAGVVVVGVLIAFGVTSSVTALMMFGFGGFVLGGDRPGVLARRARAAGGRARVRAGRAGVAGAPQPPPLRRLHRARRDRRAVRRRGRVLELQGRSGTSP